MGAHYEGNSYPHGCIGTPFGKGSEEGEGGHPRWVSHIVCLEDCRGSDEPEEAVGHDEYSQWVRLPQ